MEKYNLEQTGQEVQNILNEATTQSELTAETERAQLAEQQLQNDIDAIEEKIPSGASSSNKLATEEYVDDSVSTATATFRGTFNLVSDLGLTVDATEQQIAAALASEISTADNNDYCFVQIPTSDETATEIEKIDRYKFNGTAWSFEYELNNSGFTADQWDAINSHVTSGDVAKLLALPTNAELTILLNGKQDVLTFDNVPTENSNNPVKSGGVYSAIDDEKAARLNSDAALQQSIDGINGKIPSDASSENKLATASDVDDEATARSNADQSLQDAIEAILLLIPTAASSLNQLADKAFVNSSIATNTATFRGTFNLVNDLHLTLAATHAQVGNALALAILDSDNNDYCFVQIPTVETAPNEIAQTDRYKFNGSTWEYEYTLNNSGFTSAQWIAINSGITSVLVSKLSELPTNSELTSELGALTTAINNINLKIPAAAAQNNKLVDTAALESYIIQVLDVLTVTYNITSSDGHITFHIEQTDGKITSVSLTTSDIASAAALNLKASQADLTALANRVTTAEGNITTLNGNLTSLTGRVSTNETDIANLQQLYNNLQQSKPLPVTALPSTGQQQGVIYRLTGTTSYSDYMWNGSTWVLMATYNNAIDPRPKKASQNLVTSGGIFDNMGALDISELNATENPHTLATYADLSAALAAIPSNDYKKGGMSIKFVQTDDNKYVKFFCTADKFTTDVTQWQGVDDEPTAGSDNLVKSGGVEKKISQLTPEITKIISGGTEISGTWRQGTLDSTSHMYISEGNVTAQRIIMAFMSKKPIIFYVASGYYASIHCYSGEFSDINQIVTLSAARTWLGNIDHDWKQGVVNVEPMTGSKTYVIIVKHGETGRDNVLPSEGETAITNLVDYENLGKEVPDKADKNEVVPNIFIPIREAINADNVNKRFDIPLLDFFAGDELVHIPAHTLGYDSIAITNNILNGIVLLKENEIWTTKIVPNGGSVGFGANKGSFIIAMFYCKLIEKKITAVHDIMSYCKTTIDGQPCAIRRFNINESLNPYALNPYSGTVPLLNGSLTQDGIRFDDVNLINKRLISSFIPVSGPFTLTFSRTVNFNIYYYSAPDENTFVKTQEYRSFINNSTFVGEFAGYIIVLVADGTDTTANISPSDVSLTIESRTYLVSEEHYVVANTFGKLIADNVKHVFRLTANLVIYYNNTPYIIPAGYEVAQAHPTTVLGCLCFDYTNLSLVITSWMDSGKYPIIATYTKDSSNKILRWNHAIIPVSVFNGNNVDYVGEPIKLNLFNLETQKTISGISGYQSVATFGEYALYFSNNAQKAYLYNNKTWVLLKTFDIPNGGYYQPHCNTACVGVEWGNVNSIMPLIYVSQWETGHERACFVFDVTFENNDYALALVQRINLSGVSSSIIGTGQCDFAVDTDNSILYAISYKTPNTDTTTHGTATIVCKMNLPLLSAGEEVILSDADIIQNTELSEHIKVRQDLFYNGGKAYIAYGLPSSPYNVKGGLAVLDLESLDIVTTVSLWKILNSEPETIDIFGRDIFITFGGNNNIYKLIV